MDTEREFRKQTIVESTILTCKNMALVYQVVGEAIEAEDWEIVLGASLKFKQIEEEVDNFSTLFAEIALGLCSDQYQSQDLTEEEIKARVYMDFKLRADEAWQHFQELMIQRGQVVPSQSLLDRNEITNMLIADEKGD